MVYINLHDDGCIKTDDGKPLGQIRKSTHRLSNGQLVLFIWGFGEIPLANLQCQLDRLAQIKESLR